MSARHLAVVLVPLAVVLAVVWLVLPGLRFASVDYVAHGDGDRAAVAGRALGPDGSPVAGTVVTWAAAQDASGPLVASTFRTGEWRTTTAADGSFRFDGVPVAEGFAAIDSGDRRHEGQSKHVVPRAGFTATGLQLEAAPIAPARKLSGVLRGGDGQPVAFAMLVARANTWWRSWQATATTDEAGRFELVGAGEGASVELALLPPSGAEVALGTFACGQHADVALPR